MNVFLYYLEIGRHFNLWLFLLEETHQVF